MGSTSDSFSMGFDYLGFYWPLQNQKTILGGVYNASADQRSKYDSSEYWISGQFSVSTMHFIQSVIGEGPFVRADLGWGFFQYPQYPLSAVNDEGDEFAENGDKSGPAALFGVGYAFPVGAGGTRILLNVNYALRPGIDSLYALRSGIDSRSEYGEIDVQGSVRALSITVGGLF